jgi:hypothetical protein
MLNFIPFYFFNSVLDFSNEMSFYGGVFSMYEIMKHAPCTCKRFSPENTELSHSFFCMTYFTVI